MLVLNFSPFPTIETDRLLLRSLEADDAAEMFLLRNNDDVMKYIEKARPKTIEETREMIQKILDEVEKGNAVHWAITQKGNNILLGSISYHRIYKEHFRAEIGYMLHPDFWKKGLTMEVIKAVVHFGFEKMGLHSIEANINPDNNASRQLLLKAGFIREAYFKENYYFNGQFLDSEIYSLVNTNT
jgi:[ribosomal protein S5]-alanine N-acetyltransferase